jgi:hypothetical protein
MRSESRRSRQLRSLRGLSIACVLLLAGGVAGAAEQLSQHTLCHSIGSESTQYKPIRESRTYYTTESEVFVWLKFTEFRGPHTFHFLWINSDQFDSLVKSYQVTSGSWDWYCVWGSLIIPSWGPVGRWRVLVYMDGKLIMEDGFQLAAGWLQEREPNNTADATESMGLKDQIAGETARGDPDWYRISVERAGQYYIELGRYMSYTQPLLSVYSATDLQTPLTHLDDRETEGATPIGLFSECVLITRPGTYYIRVNGYSPYVMDYVLSVKETMPWWVKG